MAVSRQSLIDRTLKPVHRWVWADYDRRVRKLLAFAEVETVGGRDILRAAELTPIRSFGGCTSRTRSTSCAMATCSAAAVPTSSGAAPSAGCC